MDMMWHMWGMPGMMQFGVLFWIVFLGVLGIGTWWLVDHLRPAARDPALKVLRERYARGEMSREEFEARRKDLVA